MWRRAYADLQVTDLLGIIFIREVNADQTVLLRGFLERMEHHIASSFF